MSRRYDAVMVIIDRPLGTAHPEHPKLIYADDF